MFEIGMGIVMTLIQLAAIVGIVVLIVRLVGKRGTASTERAGVSVRRFFQYTFMVIMLVLAATGVTGLLDAALSAASQRPRTRKRSPVRLRSWSSACPSSPDWRSSRGDGSRPIQRSGDRWAGTSTSPSRSSVRWWPPCR